MVTVIILVSIYMLVPSDLVMVVIQRAEMTKGSRDRLAECHSVADNVSSKISCLYHHRDGTWMITETIRLFD